ncbi:hypothetical protein EJ05DRAFT_484439 [Pseudovirgaria hyperparasitica]|uniref:Nuclear envelope protein n=1 Tax=Pseudovirgaria hyperparasitica TaxID=470096 RepID=A0A6A6W9D7_9PEZI|nr:uncharacterized protein EJ05DRAFT_484439 [Pseudovirgaria hyperparasitica]KAF2759488.1 hypothetical protein EJ05DRAFT_484439 [Pseudovirgaria hyperparasitica]
MSADANKQAPVAPRARPYKDFLNADFHRRFVQAFLVTGAICYLNAILMGQADILWIWFPFGRAGVRALLILLSSLFVYVIRVARSHIGERNSSNFIQAARNVFGLHTFFTLALYGASAFFFVETYIALGGAPDMGNIEIGRAHERDRVNERPVYLRAMIYLFLVPSQTLVHLFCDHDKIEFPSEETDVSPTVLSSLQPTKDNMNKAVKMFNRTFWHTVVVIVSGSMFYFFSTSLRYMTWRIAYTSFYLLVPNATGPGRYPARGFLDMFARCFFESFLLLFLWNTINSTFNIFMSREPLKKGQPLTNDSKDPNGSLVQGLRSRKELPRCFAFWELAVIAQRFEARRQSIYEDFSRGVWKKILDACISEIEQITKRIDATKPTPPPAAIPAAPIEPLPRIAQPLKQDNVLGPASARSNGLASYAKQHGVTPRKEILGPRAVKLIESGRDKIIPPQAQAEIQQKGVGGLMADLLLPLIRTPTIGPYLRLTFAHQAITVVAGSPYSRLSTIIAAVGAVTGLAVHSLKEDKYGCVHGNVPLIVRTLTAAITSIDQFIASTTPHWTDVDFREEHRKVPEVEQIKNKLRKGLERVLTAHAEYLESEGLSAPEIKAARQLVSAPSLDEAQKKPEMQQAR